MKQNFLILLLFAAIIISYICNRTMENRIMTGEHDVSLKKLEKITDSIDQNYHSELARLEFENNSLKTIIGNDKYSLDVSGQKVSFLQQKVQLLSQQVKVTTDTSDKIIYCDSLQEQVSCLLMESSLRDSLCDKTINDLTLLTEKQDSSLAVCKNSYALIKQNLDTSLLQQEALSEQLTLCEKKLKRKTALNRWLAGGIAFVTGIVTTKILLN